MEIDETMAAHIVATLCNTTPYAHLQSVMNRPIPRLWQALNEALLALRMPLYYRRLRKPRVKPAAYEDAIQRSLAILGAFAAFNGTRQAIVSSYDGWIRSISFQPRPFGMNWTSTYAIEPETLVFSHHTKHEYHVTVEDVLHLAAKVVYAIVGANAGESPDLTATISFGRPDLDDENQPFEVNVIAREYDTGGVHRAYLK